MDLRSEIRFKKFKDFRLNLSANRLWGLKLKLFFFFFFGMGKSGLVVLVLLLLFVTGFGQFDARKLGAVSDPSSNKDSTSSSPTPDEKTKPEDSPNTSPANVESKNSNVGNTKRSSESSIDRKVDKKIQDSKEKLENQMQTKTFDSKKCKENLICSDKGKTLTACVQDFEDGSDKLTLLVQNEQDIDLNVNITSGTSKNLPPFGIPGHGTKEVNITYSVNKGTKVILTAGSGNCELQISQPKNTLVNSPSKSKETENISNPKDVDDPEVSPTNPKDVIDPAKLKTENDLSTDKKADSPVEPKEVDDAKKPKDVDSPPKSPKDVNDPAKSPKDVNDPEKSPKDVNDPAKSPKDVNDPSKSKDVKDPPKSNDVNDILKSKDKDDSSKSKDDNDPLKSKDDDTSKPKDINDPSTSKDENDPPAKHTPTSVDTHISQNNFLDQLTFYSKQVTPIYGAYFAFLVALVIGASWALCSFRKRRADNGVPYQELEMGLPESSNAVNVETAEGWDQDWDDDDWDEDKAIRSPGGNLQSKNISSNGLTSRATKKDDWDANWDD